MTRLYLLILALISCGSLRAAPIDDFKAGSGFSAGDIMFSPLKIAVVAMVFFWSAWLVVAAFRSWNARSSDSASFVSVLIRLALMVGVTGVILNAF